MRPDVGFHAGDRTPMQRPKIGCQKLKSLHTLVGFFRPEESLHFLGDGYNFGYNRRFSALAAEPPLETLQQNQMPGPGLEPGRGKPARDFKSLVSGSNMLVLLREIS